MLVCCVVLGDFFKEKVPKGRFVRTCMHLTLDCKHKNCKTYMSNLHAVSGEKDLPLNNVSEEGYVPGIYVQD